MSRKFNIFRAPSILVHSRLTTGSAVFFADQWFLKCTCVHMCSTTSAQVNPGSHVTVADVVKDKNNCCRNSPSQIQHQPKSGTGFNFYQMSHAELLTGTFNFLRTFLGCWIFRFGSRVSGFCFLDCSRGGYESRVLAMKFFRPLK